MFLPFQSYSVLIQTQYLLMKCVKLLHSKQQLYFVQRAYQALYITKSAVSSKKYARDVMKKRGWSPLINTSMGWQRVTSFTLCFGPMMINCGIDVLLFKYLEWASIGQMVFIKSFWCQLQHDRAFMILVAIARVHEFLLVQSFNVISTLKHALLSFPQRSGEKKNLSVKWRCVQYLVFRCIRYHTGELLIVAYDCQIAWLPFTSAISMNYAWNKSFCWSSQEIYVSSSSYFFPVVDGFVWVGFCRCPAPVTAITST